MNKLIAACAVGTVALAAGVFVILRAPSGSAGASSAAASIPIAPPVVSSPPSSALRGALPEQAASADAPQGATAHLIHELNAQTCARFDSENARARCMANREVEQRMGFGPSPGDPAHARCLAGELPAEYCGDVRPTSPLAIRVNASPTPDYPLAAE